MSILFSIPAAIAGALRISGSHCARVNLNLINLLLERTVAELESAFGLLYQSAPN